MRIFKAICTKYIGPRQVRGSRVKAWDADGNSIILSYAGEYSNEDNQYRAALALRNKMHWTGELVGGSVKGMIVWVFTS
jgi:hypothetical protein